jgi:hypothetical protein
LNKPDVSPAIVKNVLNEPDASTDICGKLLKGLTCLQSDPNVHYTS